MYNKVILIGRLCADPELKTTQNGVNVVSFSLAVDRRVKEDNADFINIIAWRSTADFVCQYFKKGSVIGVEGFIQTRKWEDRDGHKRTAVEVVADRVFFTAPKAKTAEAHSDDFSEVGDMSDLPF